MVYWMAPFGYPTGTSCSVCPNRNSFPFPLPWCTFPLGFHILGMEPPFTQCRNLMFTFNIPLSLTSHIQVVNRSSLNLLLPFLYAHHWSVQWCLHIPEFNGCSSSYVLLHLFLILTMYFEHFLPLISVTSVSPCFLPTFLVIPSVSFYSTFPLNATGFAWLFSLGLFLLYTFSWWSHPLPKSRPLSCASGLYIEFIL